MKSTLEQRSGFTLIELSIVLVIIGLIVGGVLVGRDLIRASQLRKMVSEVEEFKTAANTFRLKYGQLPGDMHFSQTSPLGFSTFTGPRAGVDHGDNNGLMFGVPLESYCGGEGAVFFLHLAQANLIKLSAAILLVMDTNVGLAPGTPQSQAVWGPLNNSSYLPESAIGGAFWCVVNLNSLAVNLFTNTTLQKNAFTLRGANTTGLNFSRMEPSISPIDLFSVEQKIDDGRPLSGSVLNTTYNTIPALFYWAAAASSSVCTFGGANASDAAQVYNASVATGGNIVNCKPIFVW